MCLSGCLSGRGQAQTEDGHSDKALLRQMESIYSDIPVQPPETSAHLQELYQEWLGGAASPGAQEALRAAHPSPVRCSGSLDIRW